MDVSLQCLDPHWASSLRLNADDVSQPDHHLISRKHRKGLAVGTWPGLDFDSRFHHPAKSPLGRETDGGSRLPLRPPQHTPHAGGGELQELSAGMRLGDLIHLIGGTHHLGVQICLHNLIYLTT